MINLSSAPVHLAELQLQKATSRPRDLSVQFHQGRHHHRPDHQHRGNDLAHKLAVRKSVVDPNVFLEPPRMAMLHVKPRRHPLEQLHLEHRRRHTVGRMRRDHPLRPGPRNRMDRHRNGQNQQDHSTRARVRPLGENKMTRLEAARGMAESKARGKRGNLWYITLEWNPPFSTW